MDEPWARSERERDKHTSLCAHKSARQRQPGEGRFSVHVRRSEYQLRNVQSFDAVMDTQHDLPCVPVSAWSVCPGQAGVQRLHRKPWCSSRLFQSQFRYVRFHSVRCAVGAGCRQYDRTGRTQGKSEIADVHQPARRHLTSDYGGLEALFQLRSLCFRAVIIEPVPAATGVKRTRNIPRQSEHGIRKNGVV